MRKILLNLNSSEPPTLVKELPYFDDLLELFVLLEDYVHFSVHVLDDYLMLDTIKIDIFRVQLLDHLQGVQERWKIWLNKLHVKYRIQANKRGNTLFVRILTHNLGNGVRPISKREYLSMGSCDFIFIQMQPYLISHLKILWNLTLIFGYWYLALNFYKIS
jgi:hypothetical protein